MTESRIEQLMAPFVEMILEPGGSIDLEAVFASPESADIRRAEEELQRHDWANWNAWLRDVARERGLVYADYFSALADARGGLPPHLGNDGVHPNRAGYAVMRPVFDAALAELDLARR